eukprot:2965739-Amphidinium_carterae.1
MPSAHSSNFCPVGCCGCHASHIHSKTPGLVQEAHADHDISRSLSSISCPTLGMGWAQTRALWCSFGPAQTPGPAMGNRLDSVMSILRKPNDALEHDACGMACSSGASSANGRYLRSMGSPKCAGNPSGSGTKSCWLVERAAEPGPTSCS